MNLPSKIPPHSLLLISRTYPPVLGGSEVEAQRVSLSLIQRGHRVKVLCCGGPPMPACGNWTDPAGIPVRIFGTDWPERLRDYVFAAGVMWTMLKEHRNFDVVYFLMQGLHLAVGLPVARLLGKPIVMKLSGSNVIELMQRHWLGRVELRWLQKWAYRVLILNPGMAEEADAAGFDRRQLHWMPNPVDTEEFAPCGHEIRRQLRDRLNLPQEAPVVLFVGRLAPEKQLSSLIGAFAKVVRQTPGAWLVLVGDGLLREDLEGQVGRLRLERNVRFAGRRSAVEVREWLQASDVFALVSSIEGFSCALVEAMSAGLPAVVSRIPANTQLIESEVHGLHAEVLDEDSIASALVRMLADDDGRTRMGRAARKLIVDHYSIDKVADRYESLLAGALSGRPAGERTD